LLITKGIAPSKFLEKIGEVVSFSQKADQAVDATLAGNDSWT